MKANGHVSQHTPSRKVSVREEKRTGTIKNSNSTELYFKKKMENKKPTKRRKINERPLETVVPTCVLIPFLTWRETLQLIAVSTGFVHKEEEIWKLRNRLDFVAPRSPPWAGHSTKAHFFFNWAVTRQMRADALDHEEMELLHRRMGITLARAAYGLKKEHLQELRKDKWEELASVALAFSKRNASWQSLTRLQRQKHDEIFRLRRLAWDRDKERIQRQVQAQKEKKKEENHRNQILAWYQETGSLFDHELTTHNERKEKLTAALRDQNLELRRDSTLCWQWIDGTLRKSLEEVVAIMSITSWLFSFSHVAFSHLHQSCKFSLIRLMFENCTNPSYSWQDACAAVKTTYRTAAIAAPPPRPWFDHSDSDDDDDHRNF